MNYPGARPGLAPQPQQQGGYPGGPPAGYPMQPQHGGSSIGGYPGPSPYEQQQQQGGYRDRSPIPPDVGGARMGMPGPQPVSVTSAAAVMSGANDGGYYSRGPQDHSGLNALASALQVVTEEREREEKARAAANGTGNSGMDGMAGLGAAAEERRRSAAAASGSSPPSVTVNVPDGRTTPITVTTIPVNEAGMMIGNGASAATPAKRVLDDTDYDAVDDEPDAKRAKNGV